MLDLNEYELRDEEQRGNFTPGTPDDETFHLESLDEYPGELPDYSQVAEEEKVSLEKQLDLEEKTEEIEQEHIENIEKEKPEESFEGTSDESVEETPDETSEEINLSNEQETEEISDEVVTKEDSALLNEEQSDVVEEDKSVWNLFEVDQEQKPVEKALIDVDEKEAEGINLDIVAAEQTIEDNSQEELQEIAEESEIAEEVEAGKDTAETVELDEDFKKKLQEDLDNSKAKEKTEELPESVIDEREEDFEQIEDEKAEEIDLNKIEAEHPSTYKYQETILEEAPKEPKIEPPKTPFYEPAKEVKKEKISEEKGVKKKKGLFFYFAASLFLLILIFIIYDWGVNRHAFNDLMSLVIKPEQEIVIKKEKQKTEKAEETKKVIPKIMLQDSSKLLAKKTEPKKQIDKILANKKPLESIKPIKIAEVEKKPNEKMIVQPAKNTKSSKQLRLASKYFREDKSANIPTELEVKPHKYNEQGAVYTIQVYATPSKEDADKWIEKLNSKNIKDIIVSTYNKKGVQWYRIRFGKFSSYELALQKAKELGFYQSWIDRIK